MEAESLARMAELVLAVPGLTPAAYWLLTGPETGALVDELNKQAKRAKRRR